VKTVWGVAAGWLLLVGLTACGTPDSAPAAGCDPGDALHRAILAEPVLARAQPPEGGLREGLRSDFDRKTRRCTPILVSREWALGETTAQERLARLTAELEQAGWSARPAPSKAPEPCEEDPELDCRRTGPFTLARDFDKQVGGRSIGLAVSYRSGAPSLTGQVEVHIRTD